MNKIFIIHYQVRVGHTVKRDRALVMAKDKKEAKTKLNEFINNHSDGSKEFIFGIKVTNIFLIEEYTGSIFTMNFGYETNKKEN